MPEIRYRHTSGDEQAVIAAEVGCLDLAYEYTCEAALMDLRDLEQNTRDGLHMASLAGAWMAVVAGFGGMRDGDELLSFAPRLPAAITRLAFTLIQRGRRLRVETDGTQATYRLMDGEGHLDLYHYGELIRVRSTSATTCPVPSPLPAPNVAPPPGREPRRPVAPVGTVLCEPVRRP
jgi:alpha,alpha-trehalose phosphorylase